MTSIRIDPALAGKPFPRIHEGRYEVDPWSTRLRPPLPPNMAQTIERAGVRLLRLGLGCWLPTQDPHPSNHIDREWFTGSDLAAVEDPTAFNFTHLDRNLAVCQELGLEILLSFDYMPATLAMPGKVFEVPDIFKPFAPPGYEFPDGIRSAPPADPEVFAAASVKVLDHVEAHGVPIRYVELWNEPDLPFFYSGTYEEFFAAYRAFAPAISRRGYPVGGPSWAGIAPDLWLRRFLSDCQTDGVELDFYSFHRYDTSVEKVIDRCREVRAVMDEFGFGGAKCLIDEWGYDLRDAPYFGTVGSAAFTGSCLMQFPECGIDDQTHVLLVDPVEAEFGRFHGLIRRTGEVNPIFFMMEAFEEFQSTPKRIPTGLDDKVLAGVGDDGKLMVIAVNPDKETPLNLEVEISGSAQVQFLTQAQFDLAHNWTPAASFDGHLVIPPESVALVRSGANSIGGRLS